MAWSEVPGYPCSLTSARAASSSRSRAVPLSSALRPSRRVGWIVGPALVLPFRAGAARRGRVGVLGDRVGEGLAALVWGAGEGFAGFTLDTLHSRGYVLHTEWYVADADGRRDVAGG